MMRFLLLALLLAPALSIAEAAVSTQNPLCPEYCSPDARISILGNTPVGATLTFQFENVTNGEGKTLTDTQTGVSECSTCTPCKARLRFRYDPGSSGTQACYSPDSGITWAPSSSGVTRFVPMKTGCDEVPQLVVIDIAETSVPCGQSTFFFATAELFCFCD